MTYRVLICGVDEAGRGSMLGPLVIAGICMQEDRLDDLVDLGVRDSKRHSAASREYLYSSITEMADDYCIVHVPPRSVDASVRRRGLNNLEAKYMARVVSKLEPDVTYVDSCDVNPARFGERISSRLSRDCRIMSYHHADSTFVIVSAASILAKVVRDRAIGRLRRNHAVGSGYPSDRNAVMFLRTYYAKNGTVPSFMRKSWKPVRRLLHPDS